MISFSRHSYQYFFHLCYHRFLDELGARIPDMGETFPAKVDTYKDFREVFDRKDIDAVFIATPDHWHAIQAIMAMEAGKDVYVEKPLTITIHEGRRMVEAAKRTGRVVQVGLNRRCSTLYRELAGLVRAGAVVGHGYPEAVVCRLADIHVYFREYACFLARVERVVNRLLHSGKKGLSRIIKTQQVTIFEKEFGNGYLALFLSHALGGLDGLCIPF